MSRIKKIVVVLDDGKELEFESDFPASINVHRGMMEINNFNVPYVEHQPNGVEVLTIVCAPDHIRELVVENNDKIIKSLIDGNH
jgi:hypothetical protein